MNHNCVNQCFLGKSKKNDILKNYFVLSLVSPRRLLRKKLCFWYCYNT